MIEYSKLKILVNHTSKNNKIDFIFVLNKQATYIHFVFRKKIVNSFLTKSHKVL